MQVRIVLVNGAPPLAIDILGTLTSRTQFAPMPISIHEMKGTMREWFRGGSRIQLLRWSFWMIHPHALRILWCRWSCSLGVSTSPGGGEKDSGRGSASSSLLPTQQSPTVSPPARGFRECALQGRA